MQINDTRVEVRLKPRDRSRGRATNRAGISSRYTTHGSMHTIQPARLKPGVSPDSVAASTSPTSSISADASSVLVRGRALIFWDLKVPGKKKKLDAINTDQITPAADSVSQSRRTLHERSKAGTFRLLTPDVRARLHLRETLTLAG